MKGVKPGLPAAAPDDSLFSVDIPSRIVLPLEYRIGCRSRPLVKKGDTVEALDRIASGDGRLSADIHSPVDGVVAGVCSQECSDGTFRESVVIKTRKGAFTRMPGRKKPLLRVSEGLPAGASGETPDGGLLGHGKDRIAEHPALAGRLPPGKDIVRLIRQKGIVGLGGAMFPSHIKLMDISGKIDTLLINGAECEPFMSSDKWLMANRPKEVVLGAVILASAARSGQALICIKDRTGLLLRSVGRACRSMPGDRGYPEISVKGLRDYYPVGAEQVLLKEALKRILPEGSRPADVGALVFNVSTAYAVFEAFAFGKPLVERIVTVAGSVRMPGNYLVKVGTPLSDLIGAAGGLLEGRESVVVGGPMMGRLAGTLDAPLLPGDGVLIAMEPLQIEVENCIRCGRCIDACPAGLSPKTIAILVKKGRAGDAGKLFADACIECGACSYACPSRIDLVGLVKKAKRQGDACG